MSGEIERKKFAADSERTGQQIVHPETETREQAGEWALLAAEFRKVAFTSLSVQLTDAVTQLQSLKASTSWRLTRPLRWFAEKFPWSARQLRRVIKLFWEA